MVDVLSIEQNTLIGPKKIKKNLKKSLNLVSFKINPLNGEIDCYICVSLIKINMIDVI